MDINEWWERLDGPTREWLVSHNGETLPAEVVAAIASAGGVATSEAWWVGETGPSGFHLSDAAVDWIEEKANDE